jgi:hypothetical protein
MTDFTKDGRVVVNSIRTPPPFQRVAGAWYGGQGCMLYAVCSTGGLSTGTDRPTVCEGCDEKWYLHLWRGLSADVGCARRSAKKAIEAFDDSDQDNEEEYWEFVADVDVLAEYEEWVDNVIIPLLEKSYGLEDWSE